MQYLGYVSYEEMVAAQDEAVRYDREIAEAEQELHTMIAGKTATVYDPLTEVSSRSVLETQYPSLAAGGYFAREGEGYQEIPSTGGMAALLASVTGALGKGKGSGAASTSPADRTGLYVLGGLGAAAIVTMLALR